MKREMVMVWRDNRTNKDCVTVKNGASYRHYAPTQASVRRLTNALHGHSDYEIEPFAISGIGFSAHRIEKRSA